MLICILDSGNHCPAHQAEGHWRQPHQDPRTRGPVRSQGTTRSQIIKNIAAEVSPVLANVTDAHPRRIRICNIRDQRSSPSKDMNTVYVDEFFLRFFYNKILYLLK